MLPELKESDEGISQDVRTLGDHALEAIKNEVHQSLHSMWGENSLDLLIKTGAEIEVEVQYLGHTGSKLVVICRLRVISYGDEISRVCKLYTIVALIPHVFVCT